jgi:hypothetical protein
LAGERQVTRAVGDTSSVELTLRLHLSRNQVISVNPYYAIRASAFFDKKC